ncbi:WD domain protein [Aspergillus candidus]|uniref:Probable E3 ubiquitin ligase complex SCF subunit sconB n=1 Tax=Aspergillus candidus TaxID=41067 RepID=A0A2I2FF06_ASPCN|nr:F-box domain protein [Aspergillus candidus]PLB39218.1 F-box domain protein [Aspergillus candidus]
MPKRSNDGDILSSQRKRARVARTDDITDRLSVLTNEVLLHILSFLPVTSLLICQRLSRRFRALAGDSELWKRKYYSRWVRPRARRLVKARRVTFPQGNAEYSPRVSTWLDHSHLVDEGRTPNWKRQYRLRHNWSRGLCRVTEVEVPQPQRPPLLVNFYGGFVLTADLEHGLRVWLAVTPKICTANVQFTDSAQQCSTVPTALTTNRGPRPNSIEVVVGFENGQFNVYDMDPDTLRLSLRFSHPEFANGAITAMASSFPYLLMVSQHKHLSLFKLPTEICGARPTESMEKARLLASLKADSILASMSLSLRMAGAETIISSIVYSFFHIGCGWSLGIQELHFNKSGQQIRSRLTTTVDSQFSIRPLSYFQGENRSSGDHERSSPLSHSFSPGPAILHHEPPTSVSYSHPYLLTSHPDNTLTVYLVVSTAADLSVRSGQRLWGHTSSVSAVHVSDRGKAVSVSSRGDEIRIWDLESMMSSAGPQRQLEENSIQINPENKTQPDKNRAGLLSGTRLRETQEARLNITNQLVVRGCIGFDEERVLLLREGELGAQMLECYDFT